MSLYRNDIRDAMIAAIKVAGTLAGDRAFGPDDWPSTPSNLPSVNFNAPHERKESWGRNAPSFTTTATIVAVCRVTGTDRRVVQEEIELLCEQIEIAILTDQQIPQMVQQFSSIETQVIVNTEGKQPFGEATIMFAAEFAQTYQPGGALPLTAIQGSVTNPTTGEELIRFDVDLPQV